MNLSDAASATHRASRQRLSRLVQELRGKYPDGVEHREIRWKQDFPKISEHLSVFRLNVSRLIEEIQNEDRARLLEPIGPKILRGRSSIRRPKTAIIARAAQAAYERRMAREPLEEARRSIATRRRA
jgi:hypothetical protein